MSNQNFIPTTLLVLCLALASYLAGYNSIGSFSQNATAAAVGKPKCYVYRKLVGEECGDQTDRCLANIDLCGIKGSAECVSLVESYNRACS